MCSYCGCRDLTVIGRFSAEHDEIVNVAGELRRAAERQDIAAAREHAHALGHLLHPHTEAEERTLFAELREDPEFTEHIDRLHGEHAAIDAALALIEAGDLTGVPAFVHLLRRHIDHEENGLFPAAAIALDGPAWERVTAVA
jgi:hemerythrin-like domain-containing protein